VNDEVMCSKRAFSQGFVYKTGFALSFNLQSLISSRVGTKCFCAQPPSSHSNRGFSPVILTLVGMEPFQRFFI
jgi:hypothetical protein